MTTMSDVVERGKQLIEAWFRAQEDFNQCKSRMLSAELQVRDSKDALAKWLLPADAVKNEKIAIWYGDQLIQVEVAPNGELVLTVRPRKRA